MDTDILLGSLLKQFGHIDQVKLQEILDIQRQLKDKGEEKKLGEILREKGLIKRRPLEDALKRQKEMYNTLYSLPSYEIIEKIDHGGMGVVFKAKQRGTERLVAIKILSPELCESPRYVSRFLAEMKIIAVLNHSNLVCAFDAGETNGLLYYVMEYVDGVSAYQLLNKKGLIPERDVLKIGFYIAKVLGYLKENNLVHRDVKPQNILITRSGEIKLCDLGIAKDMQFKDGETSATLLGTAIGTPSYMSPEQATGNKLDVRSDIYSLGITMYHLATGSVPFTGNGTEIMIKHVKEKITPPKKINPSISDSLNSLILKMTNKDVLHRIQNPNELILEIERIYSEQRKKPLTTRTISMSKYYIRKDNSALILYAGIGFIVGIFAFLLYLILK